MKGKYGKVTGTEMKSSIISKTVMIIICVEFINQLIDYLINCASLITCTFHASILPLEVTSKICSRIHSLWSYAYLWLRMKFLRKKRYEINVSEIQ